jgi:hypothetical protein
LYALSVLATVGDMELRKIAGDCKSDDCPAVHLTDRGSLFVVGTIVGADERPAVGQGEQVVEVSINLVRDAPRIHRVDVLAEDAVDLPDA